jgi:hypothetical protein
MMKRTKTLITFLSAALAFGAPLFAQDTLESDMERIAEEERAKAAASARTPSAAQGESRQAKASEASKESKMPMSWKPKRFFELGVDFNSGVANNALNFSDLFRKEIVLDIPAIRDKVKENGMRLALPPSAGNLFFNINIGELFGLGVFGKVEGDLNLTLGSTLLQFLAEGNFNQHDMDGEAVSVSGGIFAEVGINSFLHLDRWTFTATPAVFTPLIYIPKSTLTYSLRATDVFGLWVDGGIDVYTPFSLQSGAGAADPHMGFDLTFGAEFGLFKWLYVGGTANHIPIIPSRLTNRMHIGGDGLGIAIHDPIADPKLEVNTEVTQTYSSDENMLVMRPLTFDIYAKWKLLDMSLLKFTLKPNIGFTAITASNKPHFNWGIQGDLSVLFLSFYLGTGLNQGIWKHRAGLGINLRLVELLAEASLQSTDFLSSFNANGFGIGIGFRFGF